MEINPRHPIIKTLQTKSAEDASDKALIDLANLLYDSALLQSGFTMKDTNEFATSQAIMSSFAWLNALAAYHGFTPYDELTYPFTCQAVVSDGQHWNFTAYQMNTHAWHTDVDLKQRNNVAWSSGELKLFQSVDLETRSVIGLNDEVLRLLIKVLSAETKPMDSSVELKPYLAAKDERSDEAKLETRAKLQTVYNNQIHYPKEVMPYREFTWEHIWMKHKDKPFLPRHRIPYPLRRTKPLAPHVFTANEKNK